MSGYAGKNIQKAAKTLINHYKLTYAGLKKTNSHAPDVSCNEQVKRLEITALEKYMETGKKEEGTVEGEHRILENEEETG